MIQAAGICRTGFRRLVFVACGVAPQISNSSLLRAAVCVETSEPTRPHPLVTVHGGVTSWSTGTTGQIGPEPRPRLPQPVMPTLKVTRSRPLGRGGVTAHPHPQFRHPEFRLRYIEAAGIVKNRFVLLVEQSMVVGTDGDDLVFTSHGQRVAEVSAIVRVGFGPLSRIHDAE